MDNNKDGLITIDDWNKNINFEHNNSKFKELLNFVKLKKYSLTKIMSTLGIEGVRKISNYTLKEGLKKLWPALKEDEALMLSKFIAKGKEEI